MATLRLDTDDQRMLARGLVYGLLLVVFAALLGLCVRIFLLVAFWGM